MEVSHYTNNDEGMDGLGITASGSKSVEGRTVAMPSRYALGTRVIIDGREYVNEDRGEYIVGDRIDVFVEDYEKAMELGRVNRVIKVLEEE